MKSVLIFLVLLRWSFLNGLNKGRWTTTRGKIRVTYAFFNFTRYYTQITKTQQIPEIFTCSAHSVIKYSSRSEFSSNFSNISLASTSNVNSITVIKLDTECKNYVHLAVSSVIIFLLFLEFLNITQAWNPIFLRDFEVSFTSCLQVVNTTIILLCILYYRKRMHVPRLVHSRIRKNISQSFQPRVTHNAFTYSVNGLYEG